MQFAQRLAVGWACLSLWAALPLLSLAAEPAVDFASVIKPILKQHCYECHGAKEQQSQIRYDDLTGFHASDRHLWTLVHEQVASGAMPPEGQPRLAEAQQKQLLTWIEQQQRALGPSSTRRLNRREISAALQDVTGLQTDFAYSLPGDGKVDGFDTGAEGLQDSADSVAQMMQVTRRAVDGLRFLDAVESKTYSADVRDAKDIRKVFDAWKADGVSVNSGDVASQPGSGWFIKPKWLGDRGGLTIRIPTPAHRGSLLRIRVVVSVKKSVPAIPNPHLWVEVGGRDLAYEEIANSASEPRALEYLVHSGDLTSDSKGLAITFTNRVEVPYAVEGFPNEEKSRPSEEIPGGTGLFRPLFDAKTTPLEQQPIPFVVLHSFEIEADYRLAWPPAAWNSKIGGLTADRKSAEQLLAIWMERAWRRPVSPAEQTRFLALFDRLRGQEQSSDEALRSTFQSVLMAGSFRYLTAPSVAGKHSQQAIAARLSFCLWCTPPDEELRRLALAGKLRDPQVLDAQVLRMLNDPRSDHFVRSFVTQWLEMGQPITLAMDHIEKQDFRFGRNLKASMQEETIAYVRQLLLENRPARELIASEWTMMNDILARHYGYEGIQGGQLRKVTLRKDDPRGGGLLGQAGIQSMLCWMGENWVIYRGAWTLRRVLDDPPPPPPLEVPELLPSDAQNHGKTFRELLRQHQEDANCTVCHKKMDPLGFAFQNFDLSGRWREVEFEKYVKNDLDGKIEWRGAGKSRPVDSAGQLPRGEKFQSFAECKELLVKHYTDDVVRGLLKNLMLYSSGHKPDVAEMAAIKQIMADQQRKAYPMRELLQAVVRSRAFLDN
jgi:mono/diheme cytochrome c family protein